MYITVPGRSEHVHLVKEFHINHVTMNLQPGYWHSCCSHEDGGSERGSDLLVLGREPRCSHSVGQTPPASLWAQDKWTVSSFHRGPRGLLHSSSEEGLLLPRPFQ